MHENCRNKLMDHQIRKTSGAIQFKIPHLSICCIIKKGESKQNYSSRSCRDIKYYTPHWVRIKISLFKGRWILRVCFSRSVVQQLRNVTFCCLHMSLKRVLRICAAKGTELTRRWVRLFGLILSNTCYQNNQIHEEWIREELNNF